MTATKRGNSEREADAGILRRDILIGSGVLAAVGVTESVGLGLISATPAAAAVKPNIVFILADDLGWKDVGFHGSDIKTPYLDKLAQTGARLEQFYSQQICTPSRAAFMTGRYPLRYGSEMAVIPSAGRYGLATDEWLLPEALKTRSAIVRSSSVNGTLAISTASFGLINAASIMPMAR